MGKAVKTYACRCGDHVFILVDGLCAKCRALIRDLNDRSDKAQQEKKK